MPWLYFSFKIPSVCSLPSFQGHGKPQKFLKLDLFWCRSLNRNGLLFGLFTQICFWHLHNNSAYLMRQKDPQEAVGILHQIHCGVEGCDPWAAAPSSAVWIQGPFQPLAYPSFPALSPGQGGGQSPLISPWDAIKKKKKKKAHVQELKGHMVSLGLYNLSGASPFASRPWGLQGIGQLQLYLSI